jgi:hypothetical protein
MKRILCIAALAAASLVSLVAQSPPADAVASVKSVCVVEGRNCKADGSVRVRFGSALTIDVVHLDVLQKAAAGKAITLYIDGRDSKLSAVATAGPDKNQAGRLTYYLDRTADNRDLWRDLMRDPGGTRELLLSVGPAGGLPLPTFDGTKPVRVTFEKTKQLSQINYLWILVMIVIVVGLLYYGIKSDMLRNGPPVNSVAQAFSLARAQMAWWFALIVIGYIIIWIITGDRDSIPSSLLALLGISAATALGSIAIDASDRTRAVDAVGTINAQKKELETAKATLAMKTGESDTKTAAEAASVDAASKAIDARVDQMNKSMAAAVSPRLSKGNWLVDVLSDDDGTIALHRYQILAWTLVLGMIFIVTVWRDLSMPDFNTTLLTLMGISSGTYLGFKFKSA